MPILVVTGEWVLAEYFLRVQDSAGYSRLLRDDGFRSVSLGVTNGGEASLTLDCGGAGRGRFDRPMWTGKLFVVQAQNADEPPGNRGPVDVSIKSLRVSARAALRRVRGSLSRMRSLKRTRMSMEDCSGTAMESSW